MFTGIIEETGSIKRINHAKESIRLYISCKNILEGIKLGDSISVNGICLTANEIEKDAFAADVMPETTRRTNLGNLTARSKVNLERAFKASDRLGGHFVSGHIDGTGTIKDKKREENAIWFEIEASENIMKYIVEKGSVAIDGISLTVAKANEGSFFVSIIPHTLEFTTLSYSNRGDVVNIECDIIGKYIEKFIAGKNIKTSSKSNISEEFLKKHGFV